MKKFITFLPLVIILVLAVVMFYVGKSNAVKLGK
jgi:hypothetical protein